MRLHHGFLFALMVTLSLGAPQQTDSIETHDIVEIQTIMMDLLESSVPVSLDEHQIRFVKGDTQNLIIENYIFVTEDGSVFTITSERALDKNYKPKVVSYFDPNDSDSHTVILSLLGGGTIKTLTVKKSQ